ncbi:preprotein translocase subunit SecE [Hyphococcus flavus]|uniref:Protein translocase subunit SecE n=1 Tax=Hyphococcus flavus TaxID=1866326 RepID=A0AAF0CEC1_9PROT|nr:preprotein translocase subunit SecE [Hyphococcus flavus]WDI31046.1 preprotein translocase subunit SecE [Hyphococcus flavus]
MAKKGKSSGSNQVVEGKAAEVKKKKKTSPFEFIQQVRNEAAKVTWTTRNETIVSTIMVLIMVAIMGLFFFAVDQGLRFAVCNVLPIECVAR